MENPLAHLDARVRLPLQVFVATASVLLPNVLVWLTIAVVAR